MTRYQSSIIWLGLILIVLNIIVNIGEFKSVLFGGPASGPSGNPPTQTPVPAPAKTTTQQVPATSPATSPVPQQTPSGNLV